MEERWLDTPRTTHQGTSPSSPTSMPPRNTTTMTMTTLSGPYQHGLYLPWGGVVPPSPCSIARSTNSRSTTGVSWPRSTITAQWTNSVNRCAAKSISSNRSSKWLEWSEASAKGGLRWPKQINRSTTYDWGKREPGQSKTTLGQTWSTRIAKPVMDMGIHSDKEHGVTSLEGSPLL